MSQKQGFVISVLIFIQVLFGINFPASKIIVTQMDPVLWSNLRFLLAGIAMGLFSLIFRRKHPPLTKEFFKQVIPLSLLGMALGQGLFLIGLRHTTSVNSAILITSIPILTLVIVVLRKQEHLTYNKVFGFVFAFLGVVLIRDITQFEVGDKTIIGDLLVFLGALCFALYLSFGKKFFSSYDNMWSTTWMFLISGIAMSVFNIFKFSSLGEVNYTSEFTVSALFSILFATLLTYFLNNWALQKVSSGLVAVFIYLQPIVAGIVAYFYLGEEITSRMVICSLFIFAGLVFTLIKPKSEKAFERKTDG